MHIHFWGRKRADNLCKNILSKTNCSEKTLPANPRLIHFIVSALFAVKKRFLLLIRLLKKVIKWFEMVCSVNEKLNNFPTNFIIIQPSSKNKGHSSWFIIFCSTIYKSCPIAIPGSHTPNVSKSFQSNTHSIATIKWQICTNQKILWLSYFFQTYREFKNCNYWIYNALVCKWTFAQ